MVFVPQIATADGQRRRGVVLLVVMALLALFAAVGLAFVFYADAEATAAQWFREAGSVAQQQADYDHEALLNYFLGQLIYDADDMSVAGVSSAMRGHGLARNMYGYNSAGFNCVPYSGLGRVHFTQALPPPIGNQDDFNLVNYTYYKTDNFVRDPERTGFRPNNAAAPTAPYFANSASYTYPDHNNMFLAAVNSSGEVLLQSFYRPWLGNGRYNSLQPDQSYHHPDFKASLLLDSDGGGNVKNLDFSPGTMYFPGGVKKYYFNDSLWMDLGWPVRTAPDGTKFKVLFAPLIIDLDGKLNLGAHGNIRGAGATHASNHGVGPWEVNLSAGFRAADYRCLFQGNAGVRGRYGPDNAPAANGSTVPQPWQPVFRFYSFLDFDGVLNPTYNPTNKYLLPGEAGNSNPQHFGFPYVDPAGYGNSDLFERTNHPSLYNALLAQADDRIFEWYQLEALQRYGGKDAPSSDLFRLCPSSFGPTTISGASNATPITITSANHGLETGKIAKVSGVGGNSAANGTWTITVIDGNTFSLNTSAGNGNYTAGTGSWSAPWRPRLMTTHSFDVGRPGATPWLNPADAGYVPYTLAGPYPTGGAVRLPSGFPAGTGGEFDGNWRGSTVGLGRLDLNRTLTDYPALDPTTGTITDTATFQTAQTERQQFARDIYERLRWVTTGEGPSVALPASGTADWKARRWLAQLAVNIVDYRDADDYITPFNWDPANPTDPTVWVYGTELPKLVINEAYTEVITDPADPLNMTMATMPYLVNFWVELLNPMKDDGAGTYNVPLQIPAMGGNPTPIQAYKVTITSGATATFSDDNRGAPPATPVLEVADYIWDPTTPPLAGVDTNIVKPAGNNYAGTNRTNEGFYVLGPKYAFPSTAGATPTPPQATLQLKDQMIGGVRSAMTYNIPNTTAPAAYPKHTLFLRRLACPYLAEDNNFASATYNPYVTVDYVENVQPNDAVANDAAGVHTPTVIDQRVASGRKQPYAAHLTQQAPQNPNPLNTAQPQHTFFRHNGREATSAAATNSLTLQLPFDWLVHMDRPLTSPIEIMQVSAFPPHKLTQEFINGGNRFNHRAPWFVQDARIYRLFEFVEVGSRAAGVSTGSRIPGRININTIYGPRGTASGDIGDVEIFRALCDSQATSSFSTTDVTNFFDAMLKARTGAGGILGVPGSDPANERPFRSLATGVVPGPAVATDPYVKPSDIDDTLFRLDPNPPTTRRLFEVAPAGTDHPHVKMELLSKIFNNITTRSNVFAVWLTVGFFEVKDDTTQPVKLGAEIGRKQNRHIRHKMFAIVDRSQLQLFTTSGTIESPPTAPPAILPQPPTYKVIVPSIDNINGSNSTRWNIRPDMLLEIDVGDRAETVKVLSFDAANNYFTANFYRTHPLNVPLQIMCRGNPGPLAANAGNPAVPAGRTPIYNPQQDPVVPYATVLE